MKSSLVSLVLILCSSWGDHSSINDFEIREIPSSIVQSYYNPGYAVPASTKIYKMSYEELKGKNAAVYIENILKNKKSILLPNTTIVIGKNGIKIPSNSTIYFDKKTLIKYEGPAIGRLSDIIKIYDVNNVKIYNANIQGSKYVPKQTGEWSAGICILNSQNIYIENTKVINTWGDGIFVGSENGKYSENVTLTGGWINNARRNGISITSAKNLKIKKILISNINGTSPETGLHIEPSIYAETLENISVDNIYSYNNANGGLGFNLQSFSLEGYPAKHVTIDINNFKTNMSNYAVGFSVNNTRGKNNPYGKISIRNSVFEKPKMGYIWSNEKKYDNLTISYENIKNK